MAAFYASGARRGVGRLEPLRARVAESRLNYFVPLAGSGSMRSPLRGNLSSFPSVLCTGGSRTSSPDGGPGCSGSVGEWGLRLHGSHSSRVRTLLTAIRMNPYSEQGGRKPRYVWDIADYGPGSMLVHSLTDGVRLPTPDDCIGECYG
jgi:hypothetical protein